MTPEAQRIAIAEACGWKHGGEYGAMWHHPKGPPVGFIPEFLSDLNAMHEAEKLLSDKGESVRQCYLDNLCIATNGESAEMDGSYKEVWAMCYATATQRCEAFLGTLNLWQHQ